MSDNNKAWRVDVWVLAHAGWVLYGMELGSVTLKINNQQSLTDSEYFYACVYADTSTSTRTLNTSTRACKQTHLPLRALWILLRVRVRRHIYLYAHSEYFYACVYADTSTSTRHAFDLFGSWRQSSSSS